MPSSLDILPAELFLRVLTYLSPGDLVRLILVSGQYQNYIEALLYNEIELHPPGFHENYAHKALRKNEVALQRPYHFPPSWGSRPAISDYQLYDYHVHLEEVHETKVKLFLGQFVEGTEQSKARAEHLAGLVHWLCLPVEGLYTGVAGHRFNPWNAIAKFTNLQYLEISGFWKTTDVAQPFVQPAHSLLKLRTIKLRGYVPIDFVRYACANPESVIDLQLGILDVPVGSNQNGDRHSRPLPVADFEKTVENFDHEQIAPRGLACLTSEIIPRLSSLACLYLIRPAQAKEASEEREFGLYTSARSDVELLNEWASVLRIARKTVTHVTLEQRPVGEELELDRKDNYEFMITYCHGPGYKRFVEIVLPVLLEDEEWPNLHSIRLFGFEPDSTGVLQSSYLEEVDGGVDLVEQLQKRFPSVEVASCLGRRMLFQEDSGETLYGGDVLDSNGGFSDSDNLSSSRNSLEI